MSMTNESTWVGKKPLRRLGGMSDALSIAADLGFSIPPPPSQEELQNLSTGTGEKGDELIRVLRELTTVQRKIADLQVELQGRKEDKNVAHLTHASEMEKKIETLARITTILKDVIQNKDRIIARLQQPYSLDCIPVEAEYQLGNCIEIGLPMLLLIIFLSQYLKHVRPNKDVPIFERFSVLICVTIIWIYSLILTASGAYRSKPIQIQFICRTDKANLISTAPWFKFPYPLEWGAPTFAAGNSFAMMSAVLVSMIESTGAYMAASRLAIATPPPAYVLSRGIGWQGIGVMLDGLFGTCTGSTVSVENVGLLGLTRVGSRRVVQISAAFMIFFSILGKFGAVFASIPFPIYAALYCVLFGLVGSVGLSFLQFTNLNSMRNLFITGMSLFLGISIPQFFNQHWTPHHGLVHTDAGWFDAILNTIFSSPPTIGLIVGVILDNTLDAANSMKDRGMPWWVKFRSFRGDNRNEEFYTLPFNLNKFFPPS